MCQIAVSPRWVKLFDSVGGNRRIPNNTLKSPFDLAGRVLCVLAEAAATTCDLLGTNALEGRAMLSAHRSLPAYRYECQEKTQSNSAGTGTCFQRILGSRSCRATLHNLKIASALDIRNVSHDRRLNSAVSHKSHRRQPTVWATGMLNGQVVEICKMSGH